MRLTIVLPPTDEKRREPYVTATLTLEDIDRSVMEQDIIHDELKRNGKGSFWEDSLIGEIHTAIKEARRLKNASSRANR